MTIIQIKAHESQRKSQREGIVVKLVRILKQLDVLYAPVVLVCQSIGANSMHNWSSVVTVTGRGRGGG